MVTQSIFFGHASNDSQTTNFQANQYLQSRKTESKPCSPSLTLGLPSVIFGRKVRESFRKLYGIDIKVIYTSFKVKNYFSLKCHTPLPLLAKVVYKFQCLHDVDKVYIGKTRRHLATRVKEHGHSTSSSAIRDHLSSCPTCQSEYSSSSFRVIDTARNDFEVTIKEALHIKNSKPALNRQLFNSGSSFVLNIF